jgi:Zn-dependent protease
MLNVDRLLEITVQMSVLLFAFSFHECAHAFVALKCGDPTARDLGRVSLNPVRHIDPVGSLFLPLTLALSGSHYLFGWAKPTPVRPSLMRPPRLGPFLTSAAGPVSNLLLAVLSACALLTMRPAGSSGGAIVGILETMLALNVLLAVFNVLPIPPLDGFGMVESLAPASAGPALAGLRRYGFVVFLVATFTGVLGRVIGFLADPVLRLLRP